MKDELDQLSLDPGNWADTRALAHRMMDQLFDDLETVRSRPVWQRLPILRKRVSRFLRRTGRSPSSRSMKNSEKT